MLERLVAIVHQELAIVWMVYAVSVIAKTNIKLLHITI